MRRPFLWIGMSFACGIFLAREIHLKPELPYYGLLALLPVLPFYRRRRAFVSLLLGAFFCLGALAEGIDHRLPHDHIDRLGTVGRMSIDGTIISRPEVSSKGKGEMISVVLSLEDIYFQGRLRKASGKVQVFLFNPGVSLEYGDSVRLWGELKVPEGRSNPGQFDYRRYLEQEKIYRVFYGFGKRSTRLLSKGRPSFLRGVFRVRLAIKEKLDLFFPFPENEVLAALLIGMRRKIPEDVRDAFQRTGTTHILAVSGLNVSIVGSLVFFLVMLTGLSRKIASLVALGFVAFYVLVSGYNAPVVRAGIMGAILMAGLLIGKESDLLNSLSVAFFALLFFKPENLFSAGFQLSFLSVLAIYFMVPRFSNEWFLERDSPARPEKPSLIGPVVRFYRNIFLATLAATAGTLPLVLYYFRIASPVSLAANLAVVPLMNLATFAGFLVLPLLFLGGTVASLGVWVPFVAVKLSLGIISLLARIPFASFYLPSPPLYLLWAYYACMLALALLPRETKKSILSGWGLAALAVASLAVGVLVSTLSSHESIRIHVLKLKQGRAALIEFPGKTGNLLVNTGKGRPQEEWKWIIKPFLMSRGVQRLSAILVTSHVAGDTGGLEGLVTSFHCRKILLARSMEKEFFKERQVLDSLRKRRVRTEFLGHREEIEGIPGVNLSWNDDGETAFLEIRYGENAALLIARGKPAEPQDFPILLSGHGEAVTYEIHQTKGRVESFPMK